MNVSYDPLKIASEGIGAENPVSGEVVDILQLDNLFYMLEKNAVIWTGIIVLGLFITMLFVRKSDKLAEKKADVLHKLTILFAIASLIWFVNIAVVVLNSIFGSAAIS